jgi:DNA-binding transcriptional LysR family regulator
MELRQLNALVAVADHGTFSAAADALATVQSNVSAHVAHLERELDVILVDRGAGRLTAEGEAVVARARRVQGEIEALAGDLSALRHQVTGTARLGLIGTTARWIVPRLLSIAAQRHPQLHLEAVEGNTTLLEPLLLSGRLDLAVLQGTVAGSDLVLTPLFTEELVLVVPRDHKLADQGLVEAAQLVGLGLLLPVKGTAFRNEIDAALEPLGVALTPRAELDGVRLIASLTFEGLGPAILPATAVPSYLREDFRLVQVKGMPRRRIGVALPRRGMPSAPARAVISLLDEVVASAASIPEGVHPASRLEKPASERLTEEG